MLYPNNLQVKSQDGLEIEKLLISNLRKTKSISRPDIGPLKIDFENHSFIKHMRTFTKIPGLSGSELLSPTPIKKLGALRTLPTLSSPRNISERVNSQAIPRKYYMYPNETIDQLKLQGKTLQSFSPSKTERIPEKVVEKIEKQLVAHETHSPRIEPIKSHRLEYEQQTSPYFYTSKVWGYGETESPNSKESGATNFFLENKKKYKVKSTLISIMQKNRSRENELELIKNQAKHALLKRSKLLFPSEMEKKQKLKECVMTPSNKQELSKEDEMKVSILKKKMEIFNKFTSGSTNLEDKKKLYRDLTLEHHPDKSKYEKEFSEEIFSFLRNNKKGFLLC